MNTVALALTSLAGLLFVTRLLRGPSLPDRVVASDGFVSTIILGVIIAAARPDSGLVVSSVLIVALGGFVGTAVLARYIERRGG